MDLPPTPRTAGGEYRLRVAREVSGQIGVYRDEPEYPCLPPVSQAAFDLLRRAGFRNEQTEATWHGGPCSDTHLPIGRALISERPTRQAAVDELLPLISWCRLNTELGDVCSLERVGTAS